MTRFALLALALLLAACSDERPLEPRPPVRTSHSASPSGPPTANATVTWLGEDAAQPGGETPLRINAGGMIVGYGCCSPQHGLIFAPPPVRSIPISSDPNEAIFVQIARGINEAGLYTGLGSNRFGIPVAFVDGIDFNAISLPTLPRAAEQWGAVGHDISNAGHVVGSTGFSGTEAHATLWRSTASGYVVEDLGLLNGNSTTALAIAAGSGANPLIVGTTGSRAFMWASGVYTLLPQVLGSIGYWSYAEDVLDDGTAVGYDQQIGPGGAVLWRNGQAIDLHPACRPLLPEGSDGPSWAHGIAATSSGHVLIVGTCGGPTVWYEDGQGRFVAERLPLLTGDATGEAFDVNESGQIVGVSGGHAVLWTFAIPGEGGNTPPNANAGGSRTGSEGAAVAFDGSASSDPDGNALSYDWDFGDGSQHGSGATPSHTYADNGTYVVTLTVDDRNGGTSTATTTASITNVAPLVSTGGKAYLLVGEALVRAGSLTDPGADAWTATANFGDGTGVQPLALIGKTFELRHTYTRAGTSTVLVQVTDDDGAGGASSFTVVVQTRAQAVWTLGAAYLALRRAATPAEWTSMVTTLNAAVAEYARGNIAGAVTGIRAFLDQVSALAASGRLSSDAALFITTMWERVIRGITPLTPELLPS